MESYEIYIVIGRLMPWFHS